MNIFNSFLHMKRVGDVQVQTNKILDDPDLSDDQKMKQLLAIDFLKVTVNNASRSIGNKHGQGNYKVVDFLCKKENLERLVKYSVAVPEDPDDKDESYKYPLVAQELICHSSVIAEALIEGGWANQEVQNEDEDDDDNDTEGEDDDDTEGLEDEEVKEENKQSSQEEESQTTTKKFTQVQLKMSQKSKNVGGSKLMNKARLQIQLDDDEENKEEQKDETNKGSVNQEPDPEGQNQQTINRDPEQEPETQSTETTPPVEENQQNSTLSPETVKELNKKSPQKNDAVDTEEIVLQEVEENKQETKETKEEQKDQAPTLVEAKKVTFEPTKTQNEEDEIPDSQISQQFLDLGKKKQGETNQEEDDDFERDEEDKDAFEAEDREENPIQNQLQELEDDDERDEESNINDDDQDGTNNVTIEMKTRNNNSVISKVNINVTNLNATKKVSKKKNKKKKQQIDPQVSEPPAEEQAKFPLLDILFSFLGIQSEESKEDVKAVQEHKLNLFKSRSMASRSSAGTIDQMPGSLNDILRNTQSFKQSIQHTQVDGDQPELLPVSCGYFFNIVRQLLLKQRKFMLKYVLIDTKGALFDKLVQYIQYHSLSDLLIEIMQLNVYIRDWRENEDDVEDDSSEAKKDKKSDDGTDDKQPNKNSEQQQMAQILKDKKVSVIKQLISTLSHKNRENMEASLNASSVLIELVELEKTFEIFLDNDAELIGQIMELAVDPSNSFNQKYLLQILIVICKQLKPSAQGQNVFKDIEEENEGNSATTSAAGITVSTFFSNFEKDTQLTQNLLKFMGQVKKNDLIANLLLVVNQQDLGNNKDSYYENQYNTRIKKIGLQRLRSLELCHSILSLLFPSFGPFVEAQLKLNGITAPKCPHEDFDLTRYVTTSLRRQIVRTTLLVLVTYPYCCIGNQFCIMILDQVKTLFDVIDVVQLQKFVISEFRDRHQLQYDMHKYNRQRGSDEQIKRYWINHMNMQSAQVNQMTVQLKDKVLQIQEFYQNNDKLPDEQIKQMIGSDVKYTDLISNPDLSFWQYLCKKDFRRLDKLLTQNLGEGHFLDDSDENESSDNEDKDDDVPIREDVDDLELESDQMDSEISGHFRKRKGVRGKNDGESNENEDEIGDDHQKFMDDMLQHFGQSSQSLLNQALKEQIETEEEIASRKEEEEKAQYSDNQFWSSGLESQMDIDKLMEDMD